MLLCISPIYAQKYKIIAISTAGALVNGHAAKIGDVIDSSATITWNMERQAIKVLRLDNKKQYLLVSYSLSKNNLSVKDLITTNRHLSTHDEAGHKPGFYTRLRRLFENKYMLWDSIEVPTDGIMFSDSRYLIASYEYGDAMVSKRLEVRDNNIIIDRSLFIVDGQPLPPRDILLNIEYHDDKQGTVAFVKGDISLQLIFIEQD